jgi:hypothetical protein
VIAGIVEVHGVDGLFMCTVMAGVMLVAMGITGMGSAVKFIPRPIVVGFTNGIAILIASTQVRDVFGLQLEKVPGFFWLRIEALISHFHTFSYEATIRAAGTVAIMVGCRLVSNRIPGPIVAVGARHRRCRPSSSCRSKRSEHALAAYPIISPKYDRGSLGLGSVIASFSEISSFFKPSASNGHKSPVDIPTVPCSPTCPPKSASWLGYILNGATFRPSVTF